MIKQLDKNRNPRGVSLFTASLRYDLCIAVVQPKLEGAIRERPHRCGTLSGYLIEAYGSAIGAGLKSFADPSSIGSCIWWWYAN